MAKKMKKGMKKGSKKKVGKVAGKDLGHMAQKKVAVTKKKAKKRRG